MVINTPYTPPVVSDSEMLLPYVKSICISESTGLTVSLQKFDYYADGCPGIFYQQSEGEILLNGERQKQNELYLYGQTVRPIQFRTKGKFRFIVFYLHPPVAKYLFDIKAKDLTDTCMDLSGEKYARSIRLIDRLLEAESSDEQVRLISGYLAGLIRHHQLPGEKMLELAIQEIQANTGDHSLEAIRKNLGVTERTFERKFEEYVGISPRLYAKICRFQQTLRQLDAHDYTRLSDLAYDNGFSDQSHFIRTFKSFTGLTPSEYLLIHSSQDNCHF